MTISLPQPCSADWESMMPVAGGRHCAACCRTVVDFTGWSDAQLAAFFRKEENRTTCGRFLPSQLDRRIPMPHQPWSWLYQWVMAAGIAAISFTVTEAQVQQRHFSKPPLTHHQRSRLAAAVLPTPDNPIRKGARPLEGRLVDNAGKPLPGVNVTLVRAGVDLAHGVTDSAGCFTVNGMTYDCFKDRQTELHIHHDGRWRLHEFVQDRPTDSIASRVVAVRRYVRPLIEPTAPRNGGPMFFFDEIEKMPVRRIDCPRPRPSDPPDVSILTSGDPVR